MMCPRCAYHQGYGDIDGSWTCDRCYHRVAKPCCSDGKCAQCRTVLAGALIDLLKGNSWAVKEEKQQQGQSSPHRDGCRCLECAARRFNEELKKRARRGGV